MRLFTLFSILLIHCGPPLEIDWPKGRKEFGPQTSVTKSPWFKIIVLDVGQGDATVLISPEGEAALIDTGPPIIGEEAVLKVLEEQSVAKIQNIFISHNHADHTGSLEAILPELSITTDQIIDKNDAHVGQVIGLGPVRIEIKAANGKMGEATLITGEELQEENNLSLALLIKYGDFRYFTSGDLPGGGGNPPYQTIDLESSLAPWVGDIDVFLVPHHGSHTSSNENFLNMLKPEIAILSLGNDNDFFHPHPSVIRRLKERNIEIWQTEKGWLSDTTDVTIVNDHICILSDGENYLIEPYSIDKCAPPD